MRELETHVGSDSRRSLGRGLLAAVAMWAMLAAVCIPRAYAEDIFVSEEYSGTHTEVRDADISKLKILKWEVWYYKTGTSTSDPKNHWGTHGAATIEELKKKHEEALRLDRENGYPYDDIGYTHRNAVLPVAIVKSNSSTVQGLKKAVARLENAGSAFLDARTVYETSPYAGVGQNFREYTSNLKDATLAIAELQRILGKTNAQAAAKVKALTADIRGHLNAADRALKAIPRAEADAAMKNADDEREKTEAEAARVKAEEERRKSEAETARVKTEADVKTALAAMRTGKFLDAWKLLRPMADKGDPKYLGLLGCALLFHVKSTCNWDRREESIRVLTAAAEKGDTLAAACLGMTLVGSETTESEGRGWYTKCMSELESGAASGDAIMQYLLSMYHLRVTKDHKECVRWCRESAKQGFAAAQVQMYCLHAGGVRLVDDANDFGEKSFAEGGKWLDEAVAQKYIDAYFIKGMQLHNWRDREREAEEWWRKAADLGHKEASDNLRIYFP